MDLIVLISQIIIILGIFNVWLIRAGKPTAWRGGTATNMKEEFAAYGLPDWSRQAVGFLKLLFAFMLLIGIWYPAFSNTAATGIAVLMLGAVVMHIKIKDPLKKSLPAFTLLILSLVIILG